MFIGLSTFCKWLISTPAGRKLLGGLLLAIALVAAYLAFMSWKQGVYDSGYKEGFRVAAADAEERRKEYFDGVHKAALAVAKASTEAADRVDQKTNEAEKRLNKVVATALERWKTEPVVIYREGKCVLDPRFQEQWNALNLEANRK